MPTVWKFNDIAELLIYKPYTVSWYKFTYRSEFRNTTIVIEQLYRKFPIIKIQRFTAERWIYRGRGKCVYAPCGKNKKWISKRLKSRLPPPLTNSAIQRWIAEFINRCKSFKNTRLYANCLKIHWHRWNTHLQAINSVFIQIQLQVWI